MSKVETNAPEQPLSYWSSQRVNKVDWDDIPYDVDAVITFDEEVDTYCISVDGVVYYQFYRYSTFMPMRYHRFTYGDLKHKYGDHFHVRPTNVVNTTQTYYKVL